MVRRPKAGLLEGSLDKYENSDTTGYLKKKNTKLIETFENTALRPQSSVPL